MRLEVLDRATALALERFEAAGLIHSRVRATRHLHRAGEMSVTALTEEEKARAADFRRQAAKKLKVAKILLAEELADEGLESLREAARLAGCALAVEARMTEMPPTLGAALAPPLGWRWGKTAAKLQPLLGSADGATAPAALIGGVQEALAKAGV